MFGWVAVHLQSLTQLLRATVANTALISKHLLSQELERGKKEKERKRKTAVLGNTSVCNRIYFIHNRLPVKFCQVNWFLFTCLRNPPLTFSHTLKQSLLLTLKYHEPLLNYDTAPFWLRTQGKQGGEAVPWGLDSITRPSGYLGLKMVLCWCQVSDPKRQSISSGLIKIWGTVLVIRRAL